MADFIPKDTWEKIIRYNLTVRIPHGYKVDPNDTSHFIPNWEVIPYLEQAMDLLDDGQSLRTVAEWLSSKLPKSISHQGIKLIHQKHRGGDRNNPRTKELRARKRRGRAPSKLEKARIDLERKIRSAKRSIEVQSKKLDGLEPKAEQVNADAGIQVDYVEPDPTDGREVIFEPNKGPQCDFLAAWEQEVLYGGAAGGGKSYAMLADPMRYFDNPAFNGILFRKTNDELRELIQKSQILYTKAFPGAKWQEQKSRWIFPSGAQMWLTYLDKDIDVERYQGQAFTWVGFDELGHWATPYAWNYMRSRLRSTDPTIPLSQRATANPGGLGGWWIKKMFIDPAPFNSTFDATDIETGETLVYPKTHEKADQPLFQRKFIPAKLSDNPYLAEDGRYEASLLSLPEATRNQLLYGDWTIIEGAAFSEFKLNIHVIKPFVIPDSWKKFRSCDYGYSSFAAVHWFAIDPAYETLIVYRELYVSKKTGKQLANLILDAEANEKIQYGILDSSVWHQRGNTGPSVAEEMIMEGCRWRPSDRGQGSRTAGKNRLHELLMVKEVGIRDDNTSIMKPGILIFDTCRQIIADLPSLPSHPDGKEDIDDRFPNDHTYDSIRYGIMSRPRAFSPFDFSDSYYGNNTYKPADKKLGY